MPATADQNSQLDVMIPAVLFIAGVTFVLYTWFNLPSGRGRFFPLAIGSIFIILTGCKLLIHFFGDELARASTTTPPASSAKTSNSPADGAPQFSDDSDLDVYRTVRASLWIIGVTSAIYLVGFVVVPIFLLTYLLLESDLSVIQVLAITAVVGVSTHALFGMYLPVRSYQPLIELPFSFLS